MDFNEKGKKSKHGHKCTSKTFEQSFYNRIGQTPSEFIATKLAVGSDFEATKYLYEITAEAIAKENKCKPGVFGDYYHGEIPPKNTEPRVKKHNELVRDRVPEIIEQSGKRCVVTVLEQAEYLKMLEVKLQEDVSEFQKSKSLVKLADLLEVTEAIVKVRGYSWDELIRVRKVLLEKRGGYEKRLLLNEVIEE